MFHFSAVFAYLGPETMLPLTSVLAGVAGVLLMMGKTSIRWCLAQVQRLGSTLGGLAGNKRRPVTRIGDLAPGNSTASKSKLAAD